MKVWDNITNKQFSSLYLLYGTEGYIINETKQKLVSNVLTNDELEFNLSTYDLEETPIEHALEDAETFPFLGDKKLIFLHNPTFLTSEKPKEKVEHDLKKLEQYINEPAPYSIVVFTGTYEKLDERKKLTKLLKKKAEVIESRPLNEKELKVWVRQQAASYQLQMDDHAIELLITLVGSDLMMLQSEIDKLSLFAADKGKIDETVVDKLTARSLEQNIFELVERVVHRKLDDAFRIYYDLRKQNEEPIKILALIASQFRLLYQVKALGRQGYGQKQIASTLKVHPYRIKLAAPQANYFSEDELGYIMNLLAEVDIQLKTGGAGRDIAMELFLFKLGSLQLK